MTDSAMPEFTPEADKPGSGNHDNLRAHRRWQRPRLKRLQGTDAENTEGPSLDGAPSFS